MSEVVEIITVDESNVDEHGFFCYKSKPKSEGYQNKLGWLRGRFDDGLRIKMIHEGDRSVGYVEYIPSEYSWRVVDAPGYLVIHCLWVVGRAKSKGYGTRLLDECLQDARKMEKHGVVMVSSKGNWLANEKAFFKNGYEKVDTAPPSFDLLVNRLADGPMPTFPDNWDERCQQYGHGMTIVYADQCPYMPDAVEHARSTFEDRGIKTKVVLLESPEEIRVKSPTAYGVFGIVLNGKLFSYHYLGKKEIRRLDELLAKS
jgi:ribosomal protein S18 acetylase RimI-like enzyme